jgi:hypothetical protein
VVEHGGRRTDPVDRGRAPRVLADAALHERISDAFVAPKAGGKNEGDCASALARRRPREQVNDGGRRCATRMLS